MKKHLILIIVLGNIILQACTSQMDVETYTKYQKLGNEVSDVAQSTLLANVGRAIQIGGSEYAVEFCNLKVSGIVDSLNNLYQCDIDRISDKNRNHANSISTKEDEMIWQIFQQNAILDTVLQAENTLTYYKRINTAMPACLMCHGEPGKEINDATLSRLKNLYPDDLAKGYKLNDFRGLWKIHFDLN